ncbi:MAG: hypothetical protein ACE3L7_17070 [Candidatus Pristimantibacillus sp.]
MSVSHDCLIGDTIYVIEGFIAKPIFDEEDNFDITNSYELEVGDTVEYVDWYNEYIGDKLFTTIKYKYKLTGEILSAVETYFVTEEVWNELDLYFKQK